MEGDIPPYSAEYAKSNRSVCKSCLSQIAKESLRIAIMVQSRFFDGKEARWHHYSCFFKKHRPQSIDEIAHFYNLRCEDQEKVRAQIERCGEVGNKKGKYKAVKLVTKSLQDFVIQYALSSRSSCKKCGEKIEKDEIRISHKEIDPDKPHVGLIDRWHHVGCFVKLRGELGWKDSEHTPDMLTGFNSLDADDKTSINKLLQKKGKKTKTAAKEEKNEKDAVNGKSDDSDLAMKKLQEQTSLLWKLIDNLKKLDMRKPELVQILEENVQAAPKGIDKIYDRVADGMAFGRLPPCPQCNDGQLVASSRGLYLCTGDISGWTSCTFTTHDVKRTPWTISADLKEHFPYLKKYKYKSRVRVFPPIASPKPLKNKSILLIGKLSKTKEEWKAVIEKLGGSITNTLAKAYCCVSNKGEVQSGKKRIKDAEVCDLFIVSEEFLLECEKLQAAPASLLSLLKKFNLASWGNEKIVSVSGKSMKRIMEEEKHGKDASKKMKLVVKSGAAVEPESGLQDSSEVLDHKGLKYTATLSMVDVKSGFNSYYKLQILQKTSGRSWHVFRSWGRVGTNIGGTKLETFRNLDGALQNFNDLYYEKTGNYFGCGDFVKHPRKFFPLEIEYEDKSNLGITCLDGAGSNSKLSSPVQDLVRMIFDLESMRKAMMEFEIDLNKMPLGKLSKRQMQKAYSVLTEATQLIERNELVGGKMIDCSNRFYTLLPHDYGFQQPPLLDNEEIIKSKASMLDDLMDIEVAYNILKGSEHKDTEDPLDSSYHKLCCNIEPVEKDSEEYKMVEKYVELTHASTHTMYTLTIDQLFKTNRKGEATRFRPFQALSNRKLLWHGSRTTNFAGILSQGLRIAPPEAPVTGYMFGKGIYFADMVTKSANYCGTSNFNPYGLSLLADVALGNMYELTDAKNITKLPKGKHSVKGIGSTEPDPSTHFTTNDGVNIPMGKGVKADVSNCKHNRTSLLYNEYIVYDVAQVNLKYLVKFKFNYKSLW